MVSPSRAGASTTPRFLCDEMLQRLGRWLRAAGYDVVIAESGEHDYALLKHAISEGRLLITRDRELAKMRRADGVVILLEAESLEACAKELQQRLDIDWQLAPFSRCLKCNSRLNWANDEQRSSAPEDIDAEQPAYYCPSCQQLYWDGSHVRRMRDHLARWQAHDYRVKTGTSSEGRVSRR